MGENIFGVPPLPEERAHRSGEVADSKKDPSPDYARLLRELDDLTVIKNGQVAECLYHLNRINASGWWQLGKRLERLFLKPTRAVARLFSRAVSPPAGAPCLACDPPYEEWIKTYDTLSDGDRREIKSHIEALEYKPLISVVMPAYETPEKTLREAIASVRAQLYENWELCAADDASASPKVSAILREVSRLDRRIKWMRRESNGHIAAASNSALALACGEFVALMDHDDLLAERALYEIVVELNAHPDADIIYSDEDKIDDNGARHSPYFKSDWNPELFLGHNMISHLGVYRRSLVNQIEGFRTGYEGSQDYDLALRAVNATSDARIRHIPAILCHRREGAENGSCSETQSGRCVASARHAKRDYFLARGEAAEVEENPFAPAWDRIRRPVPTPAPLVSLIVPTHNRHDLLATCIDGLLHRTTYSRIEVIIVDHDSDDPETIALLRRLGADERVRVLPYRGRFNYSDMNNMAVAEARGEVVGLINNDIDVIEPDWLAEMVSIAVLPQNGAIGAKLLYPNGKVQHGGVTLGAPWGPEHTHINAGRSEMGYFGRLVLTANVSAATAACLVLRKAAFDEVGGLNAVDLPVAYNDMDLCLKLRARGYSNIWTPFALLYHNESATRRKDRASRKVDGFIAELEYMRSKWGRAFEHDPYFNINLTLRNPCFALACPPRRIKPWRAAARIRELPP